MSESYDRAITVFSPGKEIAACIADRVLPKPLPLGVPRSCLLIRAALVARSDGHLFQVEYAQEAVRKGASAVSFRRRDSPLDLAVCSACRLLCVVRM